MALQDHREDLDQAILRENDCGWVGDPEFDLSGRELTAVLERFPHEHLSEEFDLPGAIQRIFRSFLQHLLTERYRIENGKPIEAFKPSTIISRQMASLKEAAEGLENALNRLDPATREYIDVHLENIGAKDEHDRRVSFSDVDQHIRWPLDHIFYAAMHSEAQGKKGPAHASQRMMIEGLTNWWEICHGAPPTPDKGRERQEDPFLELCQYVNNLARQKLTKHLKLPDGEKANIGSLNLTSIVAAVLGRRTQP